ncbi:MAG: cation transporter [Paludibacteraceae bacterium]|nr:cation transporter [Paludibacteraceae bacterium]
MAQVTSREKQITRTSVVGIATNILLASFKAFVGLVSNSIAILLDAVNNLSDALSSVITIVGIRLAHRKPDKTHPFGYGRIEYFSAILIAGLVFAAGATSLIESVKKIIHPVEPDYSMVAVVIVSVAIVTKILLGRYVKRKGEQLSSDALVASGADALFDAIISASTLVGIAITWFFGIVVDGYIGAIISVFILKSGIELFMQPMSQILGVRSNSETTRSIKADICATEGVIGAYDLVLHNYGPDRAIGSVHIEVDSRMSAYDIHVLSKQIQRKIVGKYGVFLTIGVYAVDCHNEALGKIQQNIREAVMLFDGILQVHGILIDSTAKVISFDAVVDFKVADKAALRQQLTDRILADYSDYTVEINFDIDYSD